MQITFNADNLKKREKTCFYDEEGKPLCWSIYDFAFKHRTRLLDENDIEIAYVQKDISRNDDYVIFADNKDKPFGSMERSSAGYLISPGDYHFSGTSDAGEIKNMMKVSSGNLEIENSKQLKEAVMILLGLIEIER